jgi:tetratricopeptide (TPR) repeat protein
MAPEQQRGEPGDARSDQWSFCVVLHEALFGQHPFDVGSERRLREAVLAGAVRPPPRGARVPRWLSVALRRGLRLAPDHRFPSMDALLDALSVERRARRRRVLLAAGGALAVAGALAARPPRAAVCTGGPALLSAVWNDDRRQAVHQAFIASGAPGAAAAYYRLETRLDGYGADLVRAYTAACEATQVRREQSAEVEDLRLECLTRRLDEVRALVDVAAAADADLVRADLVAVHPIPGLAACADVARLREEGEGGIDATTFARIAKVRTAVVVAEVHRQASKPDQLPHAEQALAAARALGFAPAVAEALLVYGRTLEATGDYRGAEHALFEALTTATAHRHVEVAANAATALAFDVGRAQGRYDEGRRYAQLALALIGDRDLPARTSSAYFALGLIDKVQGRGAAAREGFAKALAAREKAYGPFSAPVAEVLNSMGGLALDEGRFDEAEPYLRRALAIWTTENPERGPSSTAALSLALLASARGREREAADFLVPYVELQARDQPDGVGTAHARLYLAQVLVTMGRYDEALALLARVEPILADRLGAAHPDVASALEVRGRAELGRGRLAEGRALLERSLQLDEAAHVDPSTLVELRIGLADVARRQRRFADARALLAGADEDGRALDVLGAMLLDEGRAAEAVVVEERAAEALERTLGARHPALARALLHLGQARLAAGQAAGAGAPLKRALAIAGGAGLVEAELIPFRAALAKVSPE